MPISKGLKFNKDELRVVSEYPISKRGALPRMKYNTPITPKENYLTVLRRELPLWIPIENDCISMFPRVNPDNHARGQVIEANSIPPDKIVDFHDAFG